jgi:homoserine kinase
MIESAGNHLQGVPLPSSKAILRLPATSANLGPGFDCLGLALDLWAEATLEVREEPVDRSQSPLQEMAGEAIDAFFAKSGVKPVNITFAWRDGFPIARGLGASAALRAAALLGANALAGSPLDVEALLVIGAELEHHADNMTPALLGGLQVSLLDDGHVSHAPVPVPDGLKVVLLVPDQPLPTDESRRLLEGNVPRADAVFNLAHASLLVAALASGRLELLAAACDDRLHQPARATLLPGMNAIMKAALDAGALCSYLSGGGSTIAAWAVEGEQAVEQAMAEAARQAGTPAQTIVTRPSARGAHIVEEK